MSTPEIDLRNMLDAEDAQERLDDAYTHWVEYDVIPDLAKYLSLFEYDKFDSAVTHFRIYNAAPIAEWIFEIITNNYDVYYAFLMRERDDIDFNDIVETYVNCFICEQDFIDYNNEVTLNDY
jgi:hypothetical protein